jgi:hypothetical protein
LRRQERRKVELTARREGLVWLMEEAGEEEGGADC